MTSDLQTYINALYMYWGLLDIYGSADIHCQEWVRRVIGWKIAQ